MSTPIAHRTVQPRQFADALNDHLDKMFGIGRRQIDTGVHVEVWREVDEAAGGRRYFRKHFKNLTAGEIKGNFSHWTAREIDLARNLWPQTKSAHTQQLKTIHQLSDGTQLLETWDAGPTLEDWLDLPVARDGVSIPNVFYDCAHWFALARWSLQALKDVHSVGFVHLDIKADNICVLAKQTLGTDGSQLLRIDLEHLKLIDYAFSVWRKPYPLTGALGMGVADEDRYQSQQLCHAIREGQEKRYNAITALDWRADLYSLGWTLDSILKSVLRNPNALGWNSDRQSQANDFVRQLMSYDTAWQQPAPPAPHVRLIESLTQTLTASDLKSSLEGENWKVVLDSGWKRRSNSAPETVRATSLQSEALRARATPIGRAAAAPAAPARTDRRESTEAVVKTFWTNIKNGLVFLGAVALHGLIGWWAIGYWASLGTDSGKVSAPQTIAETYGSAKAIEERGNSVAAVTHDGVNKIADVANSPAANAPEAPPVANIQQPSVQESQSVAAMSASSPTPAVQSSPSIGPIVDLLKAAASANWSSVDAQVAGIKSSSPALSQGDRKSARAANAQGLAALSQQQYDLAIAAFTRGVAADASDTEVLNNFGYAQLLAGHPNEGVDAIGKVLLRVPDRSSGWANLGEGLARLNNEGASLAALRLAVRFSANRDRTVEFLKRTSEIHSSLAFRSIAGRVLAGIDAIPATPAALAQSARPPAQSSVPAQTIRPHVPVVESVTPVPVQPQVVAQPASPQAFCESKSNFISKNLCDTRECAKPEFSTSSYCIKAIEIASRNRQSGSPER